MAIDFKAPEFQNKVPYSKENREAYRAARCLIRDRVRAALEQEYLDHAQTQSVRDRVWEMAWDAGHSDGYSEVETHYAKLAGLADLVLQSTRP